MSTVNRSELSRSTSLGHEAQLDGDDAQSSCRSPVAGQQARSPWLVDGVDSPPPRRALSGQDVVGDLLRWEGRTSHMYRDTRGYVTVGIGNMLRTAEAAMSLPFVDAATGRAATPEQVAEAFATVARMPHGQDYRAGFFAPATSLRLPVATVRQLATERLDREFLPALRRQFAGFDSYPASAQQALVDMVYNLGAGGLSRFRNLHEACESGDWARAAAECSRSSSRPERNEWTRAMFLRAAAGE
jgi:GH24 family phage-related lysozyme (muramidase)